MEEHHHARYHALLSTSLIITSSWKTSKLSSLFDHPFHHTLFVQPAPSIVQPSLKLFLTPNSFSILSLPLKTSYPATTRHYLISSTFMPHSSPNSLLTPITLGSPHTSKHLKPFAGTSSMYTSAPSTPHLEPKPSPISNQPPIDTINLSLPPSRNTTLHSFTPALPTPRHLWRAVNSLLQRKSLSPLPSSIPFPSIADTFCSFFSDKISSLRFTLQSLLASQSSTADSPSHPIPPPPPSQSSLQIIHPASEAKVLLLLNSLPNKQCELDPIPTSLLKDCASVLLHVITQIINLSLSTGNFPLAFKHSLVTPLLKKLILTKKTYLTPDPSQTCHSYPS